MSSSRIYEAQAQRCRWLAEECSDPLLRRLIETERAFWLGLHAESRAIADFAASTLADDCVPL